MNMIQQQTLKKALSLLDAVGATYAVIDSDGGKHGTLEVVEPKKRKRSDRPYGALSKFATEVIGHLKVGEVVEIGTDVYDHETVRGAITSWACNRWGNGTLTTAYNKDTKKIEALRVA